MWHLLTFFLFHPLSEFYLNIFFFAPTKTKRARIPINSSLWRRFSKGAPSRVGHRNVPPLDSLWQGDFLTESLQRVLALDFFELNWRELVQKFIYRKVPAACSYLDLVLFDPDDDTFGAKFVNTGWVSHKHYFQLVSIGVVVYKFCHFLINWIIFDGHIDSNPGLKVYNVIPESEIFMLEVPHILEQTQACLIGIENPLL